MIREQLRNHPENAAAVANALVVLAGPIALLILGAVLPESSSDTNVTVRAPGGPYLSELTPIVVSMLSGLVLPAAVAAWRTRALVRRWREDGRGDWRGVVEAGLCGFAIALFVLAPGIVTRPREAPPYVIVYGGAALILGIVVGLILRAVALGVVRAASSRRNSEGMWN